MKVAKGCLSFILTLMVLGLGFKISGELLISSIVMKPKVEEILTELGSYVEVNDRFLTDKTLTSFSENLQESGVIDTNEEFRISYSQRAGDRRFLIKMTLNGTYWYDTFYPKYVTMEWNGVKYIAPDKFISLYYDSSE